MKDLTEAFGLKMCCFLYLYGFAMYLEFTWVRKFLPQEKTKSQYWGEGRKGEKQQDSVHVRTCM